MSSPQPILSTHKLEVAYHALGQDHKKLIYVNAYADGGFATGYGFRTRSGIGDPDFGDAMDQWAGKAKIFFHSTDTIQNAVLFIYTGGVYAPIASHSLAVSGTGGGTGAPANQVTLFGRSGDYDQWKDVFLDTDNSGLDHGAIGTGGSGTFTYTDDVANQANGHIGSWIRSRSATFFGNWVSYTVAFNRKLRRNRGLV